MAAVVVRNLPEATHLALKRRAKAHGRSTEAEIREILMKAAEATENKTEDIAEALMALGRRYGGIELDIARDKTPASPIDFE